jgi:hypothetical protein
VHTRRRDGGGRPREVVGRWSVRASRAALSSRSMRRRSCSCSKTTRCGRTWALRLVGRSRHASLGTTSPGGWGVSTTTRWKSRRGAGAGRKRVRAAECQAIDALDLIGHPGHREPLERDRASGVAHCGARAGSARRVAIASARPVLSPRSTSRPFTPSVTASGMPLTRVAITGRPRGHRLEDSDGKPSQREGRTNTSSARR